MYYLDKNYIKKIAFLFLIYDTLNLEELWHRFFLNVDKNKYNIYIHIKHNVPLKYFERYKLKNCIKTLYADISLVCAQNILLEEALKDKNNEHFIFLSNSCVPFKNFEFIYNKLSIDKSYFNIMPHEQCFPRCNYLLNYIECKNIQKSSQWCILNRKHSKIIISYMNSENINLYKNIYAPDEICYITAIFINNLQEEIISTPNLANNATTFTNWKGMDYAFPSDRGLKNYTFISEEEILHLINSVCLFGRKFNKDCFKCFCKKIYLNLFE
jgi:hypothetical protein